MYQQTGAANLFALRISMLPHPCGRKKSSSFFKFVEGVPPSHLEIGLRAPLSGASGLEVHPRRHGRSDRGAQALRLSTASSTLKPSPAIFTLLVAAVLAFTGTDTLKLKEDDAARARVFEPVTTQTEGRMFTCKELCELVPVSFRAAGGNHAHIAVHVVRWRSAMFAKVM
eukprot:5091872-Pleurochrysis_carterae.AAC.1